MKCKNCGTEDPNNFDDENSYLCVLCEEELLETEKSIYDSEELERE